MPSRLWEARQHQRVVWIGAAAPDDEEAQAVLAAVGQGLTTYGEIARNVADTLFARDLACLGAIAGVGMFRSWYLSGACRLLERLNGRLIAIEGPPAVDHAQVQAG
jgi:hypothetical protein